MALLAVGFHRRQARNEEALTGLHKSVEMMQSGLSEVLDQAAPVVVATVPARGAVEVDPALTEIRATFSKKMMDGSWSWCETGHAYPETTAAIHYLEDGRTCVLPVKLQPDTEYVLSLNSDTHDNFKDEYGRAAVPFVLHFKTRPAP